MPKLVANNLTREQFESLKNAGTSSLSQLGDGASGDILDNGANAQSWVEASLEEAFAALGTAVGKWPGRALALTLLVAVVLASGLSVATWETRIEHTCVLSL